MSRISKCVVAIALALTLSNSTGVVAVQTEQSAETVDSTQETLNNLEAQLSNLRETNQKLQQQLLSKEEQLNRAVAVADQFKSQAVKWQALNADYSSHVSRGEDYNTRPQRISASVTAYTVAADECGKEPTHEHFKITYDGKTVKPWYTIAAGKDIPFGTIVYIPYFADEENEGLFVVEDRGSAITKGKIDVYMTDLGKANAFGRRNLDIYIIGTIN
jgi:3D (Asp-Asp-Asp) domain-containing protein